MLMEVLIVVLVLAAIIILIVVGGGHDWRPVRVPVGIAEVAGTPVWAQLPLGKGVLVWGRDGLRYTSMSLPGCLGPWKH
jgi:hypothetical protein